MKKNILDLFDENVIPAVIRTIKKMSKETGKEMGEIVIRMIYDESLKPMVRLAAAKITNEILKEADKLEEAIEEIDEKTGLN